MSLVTILVVALLLPFTAYFTVKYTVYGALSGIVEFLESQEKKHHGQVSKSGD